jgi:hypothetical protein
VTAPAFLLSAVASTVSVLITRLNRIADRYHAIDGSPEEAAAAPQDAEPLELSLRAHLMYRAIYWAVASGICTCLLVIIMFTTALLKFQHEIGAAVLFIVAMGLLTTSMIYLAREVRLSHNGSFSQRGGSSKQEKNFPFARRPSPPLP